VGAGSASPGSTRTVPATGASGPGASATRREPDQWFGDGLHGQRLNRLAFPLDREQPALDAHSVRG
jgi:hypothetical protein